MDIRKRKLKGYVALSILIIMCLIMASAMTFFMPKNTAEAITESSVVKVDELLLSGYEDATKDTPIFNLHSLNDLYSKLTGDSNANISTVSALGTKDASYFKEKNYGKDIIVDLGGMSWTVTYLTQANGKTILDLWLADDDEYAKWNNDNDVNTTYPTNMYGISKIRAVDLNNGGEYWRSKSALYDAYEKTTTSPFAIFTVPYSSSYTSSIRNYIVQPKDITYQSNENAYGITAPLKTASNNTLCNDAYDIIPDSDAHWYSSTYCYEGKDNYDIWKNDYLWLPSVAEVGSGDGVNGIWKLSTNQKSGAWTWLRSARGHNAQHVYCLDTDGALNASNAGESLAVRPALHLDLSKVASASALPTPQTKGDTEKYIDESAHTFELDKIDKEFVTVTITASGINGATIDNIPEHSVNDNNVLSFTPSEVGEYIVNVTPNSGYNWLGGGKETRGYKYRLKRRVTPVDLDVANPENIIYNGEDQFLPLLHYDDNLVKAVVNKTDNAEKKDGAYCIKVKDVKTYSVDLILKDKNLLDWSDTGDNKDKENQISVAVKPKTLSVTASGAWKTSVRKSDTTYTLSCVGICDADKGKLQFEGVYTEPNSSEQKRVSVAPTLNEDNTQITITLPRVETIGKGYSYSLKLSQSNTLSKNYTLDFSHDFEVEKEYIEIKAEDIQWTWTNTDLYGGATQYVADHDPSVPYVVGIYNGKEYRFNVETKYTDKNTYPTLTTRTYEVDRAIDATDGEYTAKFEITTINDSIDLRGETTFTLKWKIDRAKYDLSRLTWSRKDSSRVEYDKKNHEIVLTIPSDYARLKENQSGDWKQMNAGKYTAKVLTFNNTDTNYVTPIRDESTTYDGSFLWDYPWEINTKKITLTWEDEPTMLAKDKDGKDFAYFVVNGEHADKIGSYKYYKDEDYLGDDKELGDNNIELNQFEVPNPPYLGWYYAVAILDDLSAKNYEIVGGKSKRFSVGSDKIDVVVELNGGNYEFTYDGKTHGGVNELVLSATSGDLSASDLIITYYNLDDETQALSGAPSDSGRYKIVLALDDGFDDYKLLRTQINFEIKKVTVTIANNTVDDLYYNTEEQGLDLAVTGLTLDDIQITYYKSNGEEIDGKPVNAGDYYALLSLSDELAKNYDLETARFEMTIKKVVLTITTTTDKLTYDGQTHEVEYGVKEKVSGVEFDKDKIIKTYYKDSKLTENRLDNSLPLDARTYVVVYSLKDDADVNYEIEDASVQAEFEIEKVKIKAVWNTSEQIPVLSNLDDSIKAIIGYVYYDEDGNQLEDNATLESGKSYKVKAIFLDDNAKNYEFVTEDGQPTPNNSAETEMEAFTITAGNSGGSLGGITGGDEQETPPEPQQPATSIDLSNILNALKVNWQPILAVMSLLFTVLFMGKGIGYAGKRKKVKKTIDKRYTAYYAISGVGLFNLPNTTWTMIACIMAGVAVLALIFMLLQKRMYNKALEDMEDAKEEYNRTFMRGNMNGGMGMGQQGVVYAQQPQFAIEDMRGMINEAMSNMLPNVTQYLPQEASYNEELIQQLMEQNAQNEERMRQMNEQNEEKIRQLTAQNEQIMEKLMRFVEQPKETVDEDVIEKLVEKLAKQQAVEKEAEKEVASAVISEELIKKLIEGQEMLMRKLSEKDEEKTQKVVVQTNGNEEIIKSLIEGQRSIMEKLVDKPNEKVVEKVVEKEAVKEVPVEKIVEVEKVVPMPVEKPAKETKAVAPRLTLDEAYAKLSASQKKIFDTLKAYAMSKDKCKENKSTYFIVLGQSSVNPLVKLTIKKNTTVALFKMEDEYFKDIRRGASSDGTKMKVKETELVVSDAQALATAKNMIDLREDQIERYNDYLKEQRSLNKKK